MLHSTLADPAQDDAPGGDDGDDGDDGEDDDEDDDEEYDEEDDEEEYDDEDDEDEVEAGPGQTTDHQKVLADFYNVGRIEFRCGDPNCVCRRLRIWSCRFVSGGLESRLKSLLRHGVVYPPAPSPRPCDATFPHTTPSLSL